MSKEDVARYRAAAHAMQTAVAMSMEVDPGDCTPKHLRVGVNSALCDSGAMAALLIAKGLITRDEYEKAVADMMEAEVQRYREELGLPDNVIFW